MANEIFDRHDLAGGHFTIEGEDLKSVHDLIIEWKNSPDGNRFLALDAVSGGRTDNGKPKVVIYFRYKLIDGDGDTKREQKKFVYKYTDQMHRRFGNGLVAWSVGSPVYVAV